MLGESSDILIFDVFHVQTEKDILLRPEPEEITEAHTSSTLHPPSPPTVL